MGELVNLDEVRNRKHFTTLKNLLKDIVLSGSQSNLIYEDTIEYIDEQYIAYARVQNPRNGKLVFSVVCRYDTNKRHLYFQEISFPDKSAKFNEAFIKSNMTIEMRELLLLFVGAKLLKSLEMLLGSKDKARVFNTVLSGIRSSNFAGLFPFTEDFTDVVIHSNNTIAQQCVTLDGFATMVIFHYDINLGMIGELKDIRFGNHIQQTSIPKAFIVGTEDDILISFAKSRIEAAILANKAGPILEI
jgi:hypothetical protein